MIAEILEGLINGGTKNFAPVLEKLLNELMKIEREKRMGAQSCERTGVRTSFFRQRMLELKPEDVIKAVQTIIAPKIQQI